MRGYMNSRPPARFRGEEGKEYSQTMGLMVLLDVYSRKLLFSVVVCWKPNVTFFLFRLYASSSCYAKYGYAGTDSRSCRHAASALPREQEDLWNGWVGHIS